MTTILHTYTDIRLEQQAETEANLVEIRKEWDGKVISKFCSNYDSYWNALMIQWRRDDLITIEQDVVATLQNVLDLSLCPAAVCAFPYRLTAGQWSVWDIDETVTNNEFVEYIPSFYSVNVPPYSDGTSLGLTKLSRSAQNLIPLWEYDAVKYEWWYLDSFISWYLAKNNERVHVHQPEVKHNR